MATQVRVLSLLVRMYVRSRMEYRGAFLLNISAQMFSYASAYAAIWLLLQRFGSLGGWAWPELALLLSFQLLAYSLGASLSFVQFRDLENIVRLGTFDTLLVKPISPWAYMVFSGLNIGYAGHVILALGMMAWSLGQVGVDWNVASALYLLAGLVSSAMMTAALITMIGASALIMVQSSHLYSIFFGFWELTRYPLNIFPTAIQAVMLTIIPMAFTSFVPVAALLDKPIPIFGDWGGWLALLAGPAVSLLAMKHWKYAISRYQGGGG